jgi:hypothetical protein
MASYFFGRGGGRDHGRGGGLGLQILDDRPPFPRPSGIHFTHGVINLSNGDPRQGSTPNKVIFFPSINWNFIIRIIIFIS